jgi:hypothetical protein
MDHPGKHCTQRFKLFRRSVEHDQPKLRAPAHQIVLEYRVNSECSGDEHRVRVWRVLGSEGLYADQGVMHKCP